MASLADLVTAVAAVTGLPEATVFAYGRFARQGGVIQQAGRGRHAAAMSIADAANLLIAVAGTGVTRDARRAVQVFRSLKNGRFYDFSGAQFLEPMIRWLMPHGVRHGDAGAGFVKIQGDLGSFLEFLIQSTLDGRLAQLFQTIPVAEIPPELARKWREEKDSLLDVTLEELVKKGVVHPRPLSDLTFGEDISVEMTFNRLVPSVELEFLRMWDHPEIIGTATFGPERGGKAKGAHHMQLEATFTQHTFAAAGLIVADMVRPSTIKSLKPIDGLFWNQFQKLAGLPGTMSNAPGSRHRPSRLDD